ncbi:MAG: M60 family metallopeptidase [Acidobacteria bacterium]|nr:M60 family metallopeptidase [Acidobacteriota bacterium]
MLTPGMRFWSRAERYSCLCLSTAWMLVYGSILPAVAAADDLDALLAGVAEIGAPGVPGPLCVYGRGAFPVIAGATSGVRAAVAAAGRLGGGRVVVLGHGGYFDRATLDTADTGRFMENALRWAAGEDVRNGPRIGVVSDVGRAELRDWLTTAGQDAVEVALTPRSLGAVDVVALEMWNQGGSELAALRAFVRAGGGLVTASTGWGWAQLHPDLDLVNDYRGNQLLRPAGIQWAYDWLDRTSPAGYAVDGPPHELIHAGSALDAVEAHQVGRRTLTPREIDQASDSLMRTAGCLPPNDTLLAPRLHALVEENDRWPSAEQPVTRADIVPRLAAGLFVLEHRRAPAESVRAHPAAEDFPGPVPADAPRLKRSLTVDTTVPRWHSTGLYAAPGELVTVTMPAEVAETDGFYVRVGVHSDGIWARPEWTRMPEISRRFRVSAATTRVANAFGGLIYIEVPAAIPDDADLGDVVVEIEGGVAAPRFVRGETDLAAWRDEIRHAPAPWAEIEGRNMIVTTDAREARELDDPGAVARIRRRSSGGWCGRSSSSSGRGGGDTASMRRQL